MAESDLTLIGAWSSPFVPRAQIALNIKNLQYVFHEEKLANKSELLLKSNPVHKKIPVLIHGDEPICESLIIVEYIDETWSSSDPSILPSDPYDRAIARFWAAYVDDKFFPSLKSIAASPDGEVEKAAVEQAIAGLSLLEKAQGEIRKGKPFFGGVHIGVLSHCISELVGLDQGDQEIKWSQSDWPRKDTPVDPFGQQVQSRPPLSVGFCPTLRSTLSFPSLSSLNIKELHSLICGCFSMQKWMMGKWYFRFVILV